MAEYEWLLPPFVCGLLALFCNLTLGQQVLQRGIIFIDLAMAQVAALGVLITDRFFHELSHEYFWFPIAGACILTLTAGGIIAVLEKKRVPHLEAMIGVFYVFSACLAITIVSNDPHGGDLVKNLLNGQLLWAGWQQVYPLAALSFAFVLLGIFWKSCLQGAGFYLVFALSIPILVQTLGVYLEFAMLVVPAVAACLISEKRRFRHGCIIGALGLISGLMASLWLDLPSGPAIVLAICLLAVAAPVCKALLSINPIQLTRHWVSLFKGVTRKQ